MVQRRPTPRLLTLVLASVAVVVCMRTLRSCSEKLEHAPPTWPEAPQ